MEKIYCDREREHEASVLRAKAEVLSPSDAAKICEVFRALADPTRMKILLALLQGEMCVYHLCEVTEGTPSRVSHQLRGLKDKGIVKARRLGKNVEYSLADEHIAKMLRLGVEHLACGGRKNDA